MFFCVNFQVMEAMDLTIGIIQAKMMRMIDRVFNITNISIVNVDDHVHLHIHHLDESVARTSR